MNAKALAEPAAGRSLRGYAPPRSSGAPTQLPVNAGPGSGAQALEPEGERVAIGVAPPDRDGLHGLVRRLGDAPVLAVIESMSGARFVHGELERALGRKTYELEIAGEALRGLE